MTADRRSILTALGILALGGVAVAAWLVLAGGPPGKLRPDDPAIVAQGETIYQEHCAACHGAKLEGQPNWQERTPEGRLPAPPHDENGHTWHHPEEVLIDITLRGPAAFAGGDYESDMPPFQDTLSEDEVVAALSYIKSTWPPRIRAYHDQFYQAP